MATTNHPRLYGLDNSNRDFSQKDSWGKNQFNSSFPTSLCCYLDSIDENANYLKLSYGKLIVSQISISKAFNISPTDNDTFYAFEALYSPYQKYVIGTLPRTDLVIQNSTTGECLSGLEIKLTALPDNTTFDLTDSDYGCELVIRPDSIVYLACSVAMCFEKNRKLNLSKTMGKTLLNIDWSDAIITLNHIPAILKKLEEISSLIEQNQTAFLLQPVWKTAGKSSKLTQNCLDVFFWSNAAFVKFITEISDNNTKAKKITRQTRTAIWLYKMLLDLAVSGKFNHEMIIDKLSYNTKNDKAFASSGNITNMYMRCNRLTKPKIEKEKIKEIILGGGQNLLSPERRFDAILYNSPEVFDL